VFVKFLRLSFDQRQPYKDSLLVDMIHALGIISSSANAECGEVVRYASGGRAPCGRRLYREQYKDEANARRRQRRLEDPAYLERERKAKRLAWNRDKERIKAERKRRMAEDPLYREQQIENRRRYWEQNKDRINAKRRRRRAENPVYREYVRAVEKARRKKIIPSTEPVYQYMISTNSTVELVSDSRLVLSETTMKRCLWYD
jgi:hypothetical protein